MFSRKWRIRPMPHASTPSHHHQHRLLLHKRQARALRHKLHRAIILLMLVSLRARQVAVWYSLFYWSSSVYTVNERRLALRPPHPPRIVRHVDFNIRVMAAKFLRMARLRKSLHTKQTVSAAPYSLHLGASRIYVTRPSQTALPEAHLFHLLADE